MSSVIHRRFLFLFAFTLFGLNFMGCRSEVPTGPAWERLIGPEPAELFDSAQALVEQREVRFWDFKTSESSSLLSTRDLKQGLVGPRGLFFKVAGGAPRMELSAGFDAGEVDLVDVDVGAKPNAIHFLSWITEGGEESTPRVEALRVGEPHLFFRFDVAGHPAWKGRIHSLRIHMAETANPLHLAYIRASKRALPDERLAAALARPWKMDLGREVRSARLAPPDLELDFPLAGGSGPRTLSFAYGVQPGVGSTAVEFQIFLESAAGRSSLFRNEIQPGDSWHTEKLDFEASGDSTKLVFLTRSAVPIDLRQGLPAWASLRVDQPVPSSDPPPNIMLVSLDTLRADHMSVYGYSRPTTPRIATWAESKGIVFDTAIAQAPWTLPSHTSIFSGLDSLNHGVNIEESIPMRLGLFTENLQAAGYTTVAITGGGYLSPQYGFSRGFDVFRFWALRNGEIEAGTASLLEILEDLPQPFFVFFHTYEVHSPHRARAPYYEKFFPKGEAESQKYPIAGRSIAMKAEDGYKANHWFARTSAEGPKGLLEDSELPDLVARYDSAIAYTDEHLGRLFDTLEASPKLRNDTALIITSDHGEALGEKGLGGHASLYDIVLRVPLIVSLPGGKLGGTKVDQQVRLIDLAPTILDLAGVSDRPKFDGTSLLPLIEGVGDDFPREAWSYAASSNYGVSLRVADRMKYIFTNTIWPSPDDREELYDLAADSGESNNIVGESADLAGLRRRVKDRLEADAKGLTVTVTNLGDRVLNGSMHSNAFLISNIKTWDELYNCMKWNSRTLTYQVPPGAEFKFLITDIPHREPIHMNTQYGEESQNEKGDKGFSKALVPHDFDDEWGMTLFAEGWREADESANTTALASLRFSWRNSPLGNGAEVEVSQELLDQLRALGYVDN